MQWNQHANKWTRYGGAIGGANAPHTLHRSTLSRDGTTPINIAIRPTNTPKLIRIHAPGFFLKSGTLSIPIVNTGDTIPQSFMRFDYPIEDTPMTNEDFQLWMNAEQLQQDQLQEAADNAMQELMELVQDIPPHLGNIIVPPLAQAVERPWTYLEKIPKRIAWLIAEEAAKGEMCPISTNPISPITASVTTCFHVFETEAINEWIARNPNNTPCPVCRKVCLATPAYTESA